MVETPHQREVRIRYRSRPDIKKRISENMKKRYHKNMADPIKRKHISEKMKQYRKDNPEYFKRKRDEWYYKNHDFKLKYNKERAKKLTFDVFSYYCNGNPKCVCCGEVDIRFLTIDHINGGGNEHRRSLSHKGFSGVNFYAWLKRNKYPKGFQVLCYNCNCGKVRNNNICPHKTVL